MVAAAAIAAACEAAAVVSEPAVVAFVGSLTGGVKTFVKKNPVKLFGRNCLR